MWASAIISLLTAIFKAFPSIESIIKRAIEEMDKANVAEASKRKEEKDGLVDDAIDGKSNIDNNGNDA